jgi:arabinose-5-phosphate isomerase
MSLPSRVEYISHDELEQLREGRAIVRQASVALARLANQLDTSFCAALELVAGCPGTVLVTGMGKAGLIGKKIAATLASTGTRSDFLHPSEALHGDLGSACAGDVALVLSNSGETEEIRRLLPVLRDFGVAIVAITSHSKSSLGAAADVTLETGSIREAGQFGLAPTTSATVMLALGDALALVASRLRGFTRAQFARAHPAGSLGQQLACIADQMRSGEQLRIASERATIREAIVGIRKSGRRTGAVMLTTDDGRLSGLFTDSDLVRLLESRRDNQLDRPISEVMTSNPKTVSPDSPVCEALALFSRHSISELPVIDGDGRPVGLVDITDLISLLPEGRVE